MTAPFNSEEFAFQEEITLSGGGGGDSTTTTSNDITQGCTGAGDCPAGFTCSPDGICVPVDIVVPTIPTTTTTTTTTQDCRTTGCPSGYQCVQGGEGVTRDSSGNILTTFSLYQCELIITPPPSPVPICAQGFSLCGEQVQSGPNEFISLCCANTDSCCSGTLKLINGVWTTEEGDGYFCWSGQCPPPPPAPCASAGTFIACVGNGIASVYTGTRDSSGQCTTTTVQDPSCKTCPPVNQFLGCIDNSTGVYSTGNIDANGTCTTYTKLNDIICIPVTPSPTRTPASILSDTPSVSPTRTPAISVTSQPTQTPGASVTPEPTQTPAVSVTPQASITKTPVPTTTPPVTRTPFPTTTPQASVTPVASITPSISNTPQSSPTPTPKLWRNCIDGNLQVGNPPADYIEVPYAKGGNCWEPVYDVGFVPSLNELLRYNWRRGALTYPESKTFEVQNPSYARNFEVTLKTNPDIVMTPDGAQKGSSIVTFLLTPRASKKVTVTIPPILLDKLADGVSNLELVVEVREL